ncbi:MAG: metallophosphoesterase family protein [Thaumarchaeota archaeon]|nr:metallophosphoesterase family protein [Candidatus Calditenuaceae archaeon]MDW8187311.1 metallophosphoesterase family protein [Nitrososphaerota archaeon]
MKVLQLSDLHGSRRAVSAAKGLVNSLEIDLIILAGDITTFGSVSESRSFVEDFASTGARVVYVPGNCDPPELLELDLGVEGVFNLHARTAKIHDINIGGVGGGLIASGTTWIELSEEEIERAVSSLGRVDILVSHTPPYGTDADVVGGVHVGSHAVRSYCEKNSPILVACGHIHESRSVSKLGRSYVVNAGPARSGYIALITLENKDVKVELTSLYGK